MTLAVVGLFGLLLLLAGDRVAGWLAGRPLEADHEPREPGLGWCLALVAGLVTLQGLLLGLDLAGVPWSRLSILIPFGLLGGLGLVRAALRWRTVSRPEVRPAELAGFVALAPFAASAVLGWTIAPDYVYHWGAKAQKFFLAGGIDWRFLAEGWHWFLHPDYPNLVPSLYAVTGILRGVYRTTAALTWSPILAAAILVSLRGLLSRAEVAPRARSLAVLGLGTFLGFTAIAFQRAGDADWMMALAVALGAGLLAGRRPEREDAAVGLVAALAAASKMEGLPFAAILVSLHLLRRWHADGAPGVGAWARLVLPGTVVVLPWAWGVTRYELFQSSNAGALRGERLAEIVGAMLRSALQPEWWGFGAVALGLVLVLPLAGRIRWPALLLLLQLGFYLTAYLITPLEATTLVRTSFPRLLAHLAPTALALGVVCLAKPPAPP